MESSGDRDWLCKGLNDFLRFETGDLPLTGDADVLLPLTGDADVCWTGERDLRSKEGTDFTRAGDAESLWIGDGDLR